MSSWQRSSLFRTNQQPCINRHKIYSSLMNFSSVCGKQWTPTNSCSYIVTLVCVCVCNQRERNSELPDLLEFSFGTQLSKKPRRYYERRRGVNFTKHYLENRTLQKKKCFCLADQSKWKADHIKEEKVLEFFLSKTSCIPAVDGKQPNMLFAKRVWLLGIHFTGCKIKKKIKSTKSIVLHRVGTKIPATSTWTMGGINRQAFWHIDGKHHVEMNSDLVRERWSE